MYLPRHFREDDPAVLRRVMTEHSFATLVTCEGDEPFAGHLPFLHREDGSPHGHLLAHMARPNAQWRHLQAGQKALVVFHGPHAYVSPSWYADALNVPTWNYVVVHAYGSATLLDTDELRALLSELVDANEQRFARPWSMDRLPEEFVTKLLAGIVGIRISIERLEGKLKLSQNRKPDDQQRATEQLATLGDPQSRDTSVWMAELLRRSGAAARG
jgi:transcriptional regulator